MWSKWLNSPESSNTRYHFKTLIKMRCLTKQTWNLDKTINCNQNTTYTRTIQQNESENLKSAWSFFLTLSYQIKVDKGSFSAKLLLETQNRNFGRNPNDHLRQKAKTIVDMSHFYKWRKLRSTFRQLMSVRVIRRNRKNLLTKTNKTNRKLPASQT